MKNNIQINFPKSFLVSRNPNVYLEYDTGFINKFNNNLLLLQKYLDNEVIIQLQAYVSKDTGAQELSIRNSSKTGSGEVYIDVPYAEYQAYSPIIRKRVGNRGTYPFERMSADKKEYILNALCEYSRRINK